MGDDEQMRRKEVKALKQRKDMVNIMIALLCLLIIIVHVKLYITLKVKVNTMHRSIMDLLECSYFKI